MSNAFTLKSTKPVRMLIQGRPKTGKTGALVALAEAGFKLRILDFDNNPEPLFQYASDEALKRIDIEHFADTMHDSANAASGIGPVNATAFTAALKMLNDWKGKDGESLGASSSWGIDTIVVLDTLDNMGETARNRAVKLSNKTRQNTTQRVWGFAQDDIANTVRKMKNCNFHLIILCHPKIIGPNTNIEEDDSAEIKDAKNALAALTPTRLYPSVPGKALAQVIGGMVPIILKSEVAEYHGRMRNVFDASPTMDTDTGAPVKGIKWPQPAETALVTLFKAMGVPAPIAYPEETKT